MKIRSAIDHYDIFSKEYDSLSKKHFWYSPEILFGLLFEFVKKGQELLDVGIGTGQSALPFKKIGLQIYGIDGSEEMLRICRKKLIAKELMKLDLNEGSFSYKSTMFDHVISNGVFYFFKDLNTFFKE